MSCNWRVAVSSNSVRLSKWRKRLCALVVVAAGAAAMGAVVVAAGAAGAVAEAQVWST